jgi:hypothetical protein
MPSSDHNPDEGAGSMAELTTLDEKLGEVIGLAQAAKGATDEVAKLLDDESVIAIVRRMHDEAIKTEELSTEYISSEKFSGKKTAILDKARETKQEATEMMTTYLGSDADGLDGFEFLTMAEAGEVGHWKVVEKLNEQLADRELKELTDFVIPLQEKHLTMSLEGSLVLAGQEDATGPA